MRNFFIVILLFLLGCNYQKEDVIGEWHIQSLSEYPLSISNYDDAVLNKDSKIIIKENGILDFYYAKTDSITESYQYYIENNQLVLVYSDYGIPLIIKELNSDKLILTAGGYGNTEAKRNRKIKIELKR